MPGKQVKTGHIEQYLNPQKSAPTETLSFIRESIASIFIDSENLTEL